MKRNIVWTSFLTATLVILTGSLPNENPDWSNKQVHYLEIVSNDVAGQCAALEKIYGMSFAPPNPILGGARIAETPDGRMIGVRAPLAAHEQPITRSYLEVEDIAKAVKEAASAGAVIAYPPAKHGNTGTYAIYILDDVQIGLRQR